MPSTGRPRRSPRRSAFHGAFWRLAAGVVAGLCPDRDIISWGRDFDLFVSIEMFPRAMFRCLAQFEQITSEAVLRFQQQELQPHPLKVRWAFGTPCHSISPNGARAINEIMPSIAPLHFFLPEGLRAAPHLPYFKAVGIDVTLNAVYRELRAFICFPPPAVTRNEISKSTISSSR